MDEAAVKARLEQIAQQMKNPNADLEALSAEIDKLLGTTLPSEDNELASQWEKQTRRSRR
jgi:hypothetical protein